MDFYLVSTELAAPYAPRTCSAIQRIRSDVRDDLAVVTIDPPLSRTTFGTDADVRYLILASRLQGSSLFPIVEWPTFVYVCRVESWPVQADIGSQPLTILDWGAVHRTKADAQKALPAVDLLK